MRVAIFIVLAVMLAIATAQGSHQVITNRGDLPYGTYLVHNGNGIYAFVPRNSGVGVIYKSTDNGATFQAVLPTGTDSTSGASGLGYWAQALSVFPLGDSCYWMNAYDATALYMGRQFYDGGAVRDTILPKRDTVSSLLTHSQTGVAALQLYRGSGSDSMITWQDTSTGSTGCFAIPFRHEGLLRNSSGVNDANAWSAGTPLRINTTRSEVMGFQALDYSFVFSMYDRRLWVTDGLGWDTVLNAKSNWYLVEGYQTTPEWGRENVRIVPRSAHDSIIAVLFETGDTGVVAIGKLTGTFHYGVSNSVTWEELDRQRIDSRQGPTGDAVTARRYLRGGWSGDRLKIWYIDYPNTANADSVNLVERHCDVSSGYPVTWSQEHIVEAAVEATPKVYLSAPLWYYHTGSNDIAFCFFRDTAAAGSRRVYSVIDTFSVITPLGLVSLLADSLPHDIAGEEDSIQIRFETPAQSGNDSVIICLSASSYQDSSGTNRNALLYQESSTDTLLLTLTLTEPYTLYVSAWIRRGSYWSARSQVSIAFAKGQGKYTLIYKKEQE